MIGTKPRSSLEQVFIKLVNESNDKGSDSVAQKTRTFVDQEVQDKSIDQD